jgi:hypothetical protein
MFISAEIKKNNYGITFKYCIIRFMHPLHINTRLWDEEWERT